MRSHGHPPSRASQQQQQQQAPARTATMPHTAALAATSTAYMFHSASMPVQRAPPPGAPAMASEASVRPAEADAGASPGGSERFARAATVEGARAAGEIIAGARVYRVADQVPVKMLNARVRAPTLSGRAAGGAPFLMRSKSARLVSGKYHGTLNTDAAGRTRQVPAVTVAPDWAVAAAQGSMYSLLQRYTLDAC